MWRRICRGLGRAFAASVSTASPSRASRWPGSGPPPGPPVLWSIELGEGHAGAAVRDGRVFVLDYDRAASADVLRCLSLADGQRHLAIRLSGRREAEPRHVAHRARRDR